MPIAKKVRCQGPTCGRMFYASRKDTKFCSQKCRYRMRRENAKFLSPLKKSGHQGVYWNRINKTWSVTIPDVTQKSRQKYVGSFKVLEEAVKFREEILKTS